MSRKSNQKREKKKKAKRKHANRLSNQKLKDDPVRIQKALELLFDPKSLTTPLISIKMSKIFAPK